MFKQGEIEYQFANQTDNDSFSLTFQYGSSSVGPFQLQIPVPEINVHACGHCIGGVWGGVVNLKSSHLLAKDNCGGMNDSLVYHILVSPHKPIHIQFNEHYSYKLHTN